MVRKPKAPYRFRVQGGPRSSKSSAFFKPQSFVVEHSLMRLRQATFSVWKRRIILHDPQAEGALPMVDLERGSGPQWRQPKGRWTVSLVNSGGSICGKLAYDLHLGCLQGGGTGVRFRVQGLGPLGISKPGWQGTDIQKKKSLI